MDDKLPRKPVRPSAVSGAGLVGLMAAASARPLGAKRILMVDELVGVGVVGLFDETPIDTHRRVIEANLISHMNGAHAGVPHFRARGRGTLINMISLGGFVPSPYAAAYSASKFGIRGFSEALRAELSSLPDVHVCEVYPTFINTPGMSHGANYSGRTVKPPPLLVDPRRVAATLLSLSYRPRSAVFLGAASYPGIAPHALAPDWVGRLVMGLMSAAFRHADPAQPTKGNLFEASRGNAIDGGFTAGPMDMLGQQKSQLAIGVRLAAALAVWRLQGRRRARR